MTFTMYGVLTVLFSLSFMWYTDKFLVKWVLGITGVIGVVSVVFSCGLGMWKFLLAIFVIYLAMSVKERRLMNTLILSIWFLAGIMLGVLLLNNLGVQDEKTMIYSIMSVSIIVSIGTSFLIGINDRIEGYSLGKSLVLSVLVVIVVSTIGFLIMSANGGLYLEVLKESASIKLDVDSGYVNLPIALEFGLIAMLAWVSYKRIWSKEVWESHRAKWADLRLGVFIGSIAVLSMIMIKLSVVTAVVVGLAGFILVMMRKSGGSISRN